MEALPFDELFSILCKRLSIKNNVQNISKQFLDTTADQGRVAIARAHITECDMLLRKTKSSDESTKSRESSTKLRNEGNKAFGKANAVLPDALLLYTQSIVYAPYPMTEACASEELALAFANRSAVFYAMKQYAACLSDIEQALLFKYPASLQHKVMERRGKCFQHMGLYEEARQSFQAALATPLPKERIPPLKASLHQLNLGKDSTRTHKDVKSTESRPAQKSYGENPLIPSASDCLQIQYSEDMGRFVEATRDINPGDILLIEEPYASVLLPQYYLTHCSHCLARCAALIPCKYCVLVMYCCELCRSSAWHAHHEIECRCLPALNKLDLGKAALLALRIITVASKSGSQFLQLYREIQELEKTNSDGIMKGCDYDGRYLSSEYKTIHSLVGNTEHRTVGDLFKRATKAAYILNCLEIYSDIFNRASVEETVPDVRLFVGGVLLRFLQSLPCNAHSVSDLVASRGQQIPDSAEFACGAYATLSLFNHSCDPNVTRSNRRGSVALLMAVRPIKKGEQIVDNYGYHYAMQGLAERLTGLRTQYYFTCRCEACTADWPAYQQLPHNEPTYICVTCRSTLASSPQCAQSGSVIAVCDNCREENNISQLDMKLKIVVERFNAIYEKLLEGSDNNFVSELSDHLLFLDQSVKRPWRLFNDCQEALKECIMRNGNFYIQ